MKLKVEPSYFAQGKVDNRLLRRFEVKRMDICFVSQDRFVCIYGSGIEDESL